MELKFDEIKPVGNFEKPLELFRNKVDLCIGHCHAEQKYNSAVANLIKLIVGDFALISVLEDGILKKSCWNIEEAKICLLYTHLLIIDLNDVAMLYLNQIKMPSRMEQLQDFINTDETQIFKGIILI